MRALKIMTPEHCPTTIPPIRLFLLDQIRIYTYSQYSGPCLSIAWPTVPVTFVSRPGMFRGAISLSVQPVLCQSSFSRNRLTTAFYVGNPALIKAKSTPLLKLASTSIRPKSVGTSSTPYK